MIEVLLGLGVLGTALLLGVVVLLARQGRISSRSLGLLAVGCSVALLAMLVTDWPSEVLATFWADHSVLAGVLSTVLMLGIGFLVFEVREVQEQEALDQSLTAAGLGGLVDHVVDVEVALALMTQAEPPDKNGWPEWSTDGRPLRWLRSNRTRLARTKAGAPGPGDPRRWGSSAPAAPGDSGWRAELADQCVRRLLAAIRDWAPVVDRSRTGLNALISLAQLRNTLMAVSAHLEQGRLDEACSLSLEIRRQCRVLALTLEVASSAPSPRAEVLLTLEPLGSTAETRQHASRWVKSDWAVSQDHSLATLREDTPR